MKPINKRTYKNFLIVYNEILAKGYSEPESWKITDRIFSEFEMNPQGLPILSRVEMIVSADYYEAQ